MYGDNDRLELFGRIVDGYPRGGLHWDVIGKEFLFTGKPPWEKQWRGMKGSAKEKLAAFDPELATKLERREITLHAAKMTLLQYNCDMQAKREIALLQKATPPYMTLVPRRIGLGSHVSFFLVLKCKCGAKWEGLSFYTSRDWYWVACPTCHVRNVFELRWDGATGGRFEPREASTNPGADMAAGLNQCVPIRELEKAS